ncbi:MAG: pyroglutamyl-peptidase I [Stenotrophomonas sp.]|uniref:pyroglutamyl-peptidase I n=1 Tax=Stenotrophomonas sp. TaxID=69392 RepID=UPI0028B12E4D|nr:pyroglutamyl-peptidase I [Stenotrophomonas sp.]
MPTSRQSPTLLLTGFGPFGGHPGNPSQDVIRALHDTQIAGHRVISVELPVVFGDALQALRRALRRSQPALVICIGQAGGRAAISLERIAINVDDARIADNAGAQPVDLPVIDGAPAAYFTSLPIKAMLQALREAGIPAEVSQTAGTFVCNHVFYGLMHALRRRKGVRGGFVHIPFSPRQAEQQPGQPSLPVETMIEGIRIAIEAALQHHTDLAIQAGAEH